MCFITLGRHSAQCSVERPGIRFSGNPNLKFEIFGENLICPGLGNTRRIVLQYNSGLTELQGIGQNISPGEFYWRELIKSTRSRKRIGKTLYFQQKQ